MKMMMISIFT